MHPQNTEQPNQRINYIDTWRFLAVLMVIQAHVIMFSGVEIPALLPYELALDRLSELGVLIFFCISGYVICAGLVKERATTGWICLSAFYLRRCLRIMPPLWLYLATLMLLQNLQLIKITGVQAATSLLFLCNMPLPQQCSWYAGHTWTLAYEEQFYLLFPCLFIGWLVRNPFKRLVLVLASLGMGSVLLRAQGMLLLADFMMYFSFMLAGCCAALLPPASLQRYRNQPLLRWLVVIGVLLLGVCYLPVAWEKYCKTLCYPILIVYMILGTPMQLKPIAQFFNNTYTCYLGRISYTLYLWQELATAYYYPASLSKTLSLLLLVLVYALWSFHYVELPLMAKAAHWSKQLKLKYTPASYAN